MLTLLAIDNAGSDYEIFAPNVMQHHVINHLTGNVTDESRNVLVESARIARGRIKALTEYNPADFDALVFPGGYGAAKNLCTYAFDGVDCRVDRVVEAAIRDTHRAKKPLGALCISPALIARVLGDVTVTIGNDKTTASDIESLGGKHETKKHGEVCVDEKNLIVTAPCYMLDSNISDIALDAAEMIRAVISLAGKTR